MATNFQIALTNYDCDNSYSNAVRFDNREKQGEYFKVFALFQNAPQVNFNISTLLTTKFTYKFNEPITKIMNYNYCIVKDNSENALLKYYYYFVKDIFFGVGGQSNNDNGMVTINVELDVFQTYYIDINFSDCMINRAHLDRWIYNGNNVKFNNNIDSHLLNNEGIETPQFAKYQERYNSDYTNFTIDYNDFSNPYHQISVLSEHLCNDVAWLQIFIKDNTFIGDTIPQFVYGSGETGHNISSGFHVIIAPLYNKSGHTNIKLKGLSEWSAENIFRIIKENSLSPYILNIKITPICPLIANTYFNTDYGYSDVNNTIELINLLKFGIRLHRELPFLIHQSNGRLHMRFNLYYKTEFTKAELKGNRNINYNPKLLSQSFRTLKIYDYCGNSFDIDMQKINNNVIKLYCQETISCDITKGYISLDDKPYEIKSGYNGLVYSNDTSIPFSVSQIDEFLANNKNYAMLQQAQRNYNENLGQAQITATGVKGAGNILANLGNLSKMMTGAVNAGTDIALIEHKYKLDNWLSKVTQTYTIDNLQSAPSTLKNAQGNILFNYSVKDCKPFFEFVYTSFYGIDGEKADDFMFCNGYNYERFGNIKNYDNIRKYFNYIKAEIENQNISYNLSNTARQKIRDIFANGIRLWNVTDEMFKYDKENYERGLE